MLNVRVSILVCVCMIEHVFNAHNKTRLDERLDAAHCRSAR